VLVDDSYNSNPLAIERMLDVVAADRSCARRVAVLGEMLELGAESVRLHRACGVAVAHAGIAYLVTVRGQPARALGDAAVAAGVPGSSVIHAGTSEEAASRIAAVIRRGDLVLVKGSRGIHTDLVADRIRQEFA
jgi:UDP-N-acetylmuramoyl-tripeptide--D-alanyl-D-alanine ligase